MYLPDSVYNLLSIYIQAAPSILMTLPYTHSSSWLVKNHTTQAMSIGRATRWRGLQVATYCTLSADAEVLRTHHSPHQPGYGSCSRRWDILPADLVVHISLGTSRCDTVDLLFCFLVAHIFERSQSCTNYHNTQSTY